MFGHDGVPWSLAPTLMRNTATWNCLAWLDVPRTPYTGGFQPEIRGTRRRGECGIFGSHLGPEEVSRLVLGSRSYPGMALQLAGRALAARRARPSPRPPRLRVRYFFFRDRAGQWSLYMDRRIKFDADIVDRWQGADVAVSSSLSSSDSIGGSMELVFRTSFSPRECLPRPSGVRGNGA